MGDSLSVVERSTHFGDMSLESVVIISILRTYNLSAKNAYFYFRLGESRRKILMSTKDELVQSGSAFVLFQVDEAKEIKVDLYDAASKNDNECIASVVIPLAPFTNVKLTDDKSTGKFLLTSEAGIACGDILLKIEYHPPLEGKVYSDRTSIEKLTIADVVKLRKAFETFDKDKNGLITKSELAAAWKTGGKRFTDKQVEEAMKQFDNGRSDGKIDFGEFIVMSTPIPKSEIDGFRAFFDHVDRDKNGLVTKSELDAYYKSRGLKFNDFILNQMISTAENIGRQDLTSKPDGKLNFAEFLILSIALLCVDGIAKL